MNEKAEFLKKLSQLLETARKQGNSITINEVESYFSEEALNTEQTDLVFDYLLSQKIAVKGYVKMEEESKGQERLTEAERRYLEEYRRELNIQSSADQEKRQELIRAVADGDAAAKEELIALYLWDVVEIAIDMKRSDVFLEDLVQEGNLGLVLAVEMLSDISCGQSGHEQILAQIQQSMQMFLEESEELSNRDKKMVEKVNLLDEAITSLTKELGRKVTIDELAIHMGMEIDEITDILKLTGEDPEEEQN